MRDDQRPAPHNHGDDQDDPWDDALDDIFGPDDDELETRPRPSRQTPQPAGGNNPPPHVYEPDANHHRMDDRHVLGNENQAPPPSYHANQESPEESPAAPYTRSAPIEKPGRNWRKIACFGCLVLTGIPAMCLAALVVYGLINDAENDVPDEPSGGVFVEEPTAATDSVDITSEPTMDRDQVSGQSGQSPQSSGSFQDLMDGREEVTMELDGEPGFGTVEKPIPVGVVGPLGGGWMFQVDAIDADATQSVLDANMFNEPPAAERQFVMAAITATNATNRTEMFDASYRLRLLGTTSGTVYTTFEEGNRCGVIPEPVEDIDLSPGDMISGNVCWQVLKDDIDSLVLFNEAFLDTDLAIWFDATAGGNSAGS